MSDVVIPSRWWAIDTEGCGTTARRLGEISLAEFVDFAPTGLIRTWRIDPEGPISPFAVRLHGIRRADLIGCPTIHDAAGEIAEALEDLPIIGHSVRNDLVALQRALTNWKPIAACCTQRMAQALMPRIGSLRLTRIGDTLGLTNRARGLTKSFPHSAPYDAMLSGLVAGHFVRKVGPAEAPALLERTNALRAANPRPFRVDVTEADQCPLSSVQSVSNSCPS